MTLTMDRTQTHPAVRPFGLSKAVPVADETLTLPALHLCPERQISVTATGTPFIYEPSMKSQAHNDHADPRGQPAGDRHRERHGLTSPDRRI
ncbi:putative ATP-grasp-modified RiPP [Streptomyces sp. GMR22]|uniref:putative ATP-grasp-modified RiPP n=1 Tax=Streptomyces sp. GMR22 TaxID=2759524 RepID=UPI001F1EEAEF|nr:putative ATP-grasp-modified RiPP [Streptomyces sp. GMR22]